MFLLPVQMRGCSHETTASDVVGRLRLPAAAVDACLDELRRDGVPAVLLSTCHRSELYWWGDADLTSWFESRVMAHGDGSALVEHLEADLAVRHLFEVTAGMRSARFGEPEIMRQVRTAWLTAQAAKATNSLLDTIFQRALEAARHIRIAIGTDADPTLGARVRDAVLARAPCAGHAPPLELLLIGAGDVARGLLEAVADAALRTRMRVSLTSRSDRSASRLAAAFGVTVVPWVARDLAISSAEVVVFAVQASTPLIAGSLARELTAARSAPALWLDLGVPSNVDARALPPTVEWLGLETIAPRSGRDVVRDRRARASLQRELARFAADMLRRRLGARITMLEAHATTVARAALSTSGELTWSAASADAMARRVTQALLREITDLSA